MHNHRHFFKENFDAKKLEGKFPNPIRSHIWLRSLEPLEGWLTIKWSKAYSENAGSCSRHQGLVGTVIPQVHQAPVAASVNFKDMYNESFTAI